MPESAADDTSGGRTDGREFAIDRFMRPIRLGFRGLTVVLLVVMITLPFVQIILREIVGRPIVGAEEFARFMLICLVYLSLPHVVYAGATIRLEELIALLPDGPLRWFRLVIMVVSVAVFVIGVVATLYAIGRNLNTVTPTLQMPYWLFLSSVLIGFALAAVETVIVFFKLLANRPLYILFPDERPLEESLTL